MRSQGCQMFFQFRLRSVIRIDTVTQALQRTLELVSDILGKLTKAVQPIKECVEPRNLFVLILEGKSISPLVTLTDRSHVSSGSLECELLVNGDARGDELA